MRRIFSKDQLMAVADGRAYVFIPTQVLVAVNGRRINSPCYLCDWSASRDRKCGLYNSDILCNALVRRDRKNGYWKRAMP